MAPINTCIIVRTVHDNGHLPTRITFLFFKSRMTNLMG